MKLTLRQMQIFLNVVKSGHLTNVAKEMKLSQSAISMSIKEMENILMLVSIYENLKNILDLIPLTVVLMRI